MENTIEQPVEQEIQAAPVETVEAPIEVAEQVEQVEAVVEDNTTKTVPYSRFNEIYYAKKQLENEVAQLRESQAAPAPQQQLSQAPTLADCDYDESAFAEKLIDFKLGQRDEQKKISKQQESQKKMVAGFREKQNEYEISNPQYQQLVNQAQNAGVVFNDNVAEMLLTSDVGPKVHHHILANAGLIDEINNMSTVQSVRKFIELENKFKATAPKVSKAPAPVESIAGGATSGKAPAKMSPSEYYAHTMANRKKR